MDGFLRQSTAVDLPIGPFLDATDGVTAETGLTISQADVRLKKNNGAWAQINDATAATHEENGWYEKEFDATDTNTVGILKVAVHETGALPVFHTFQVLEEAVYDALFASNANIDGAIAYGTAQSGTATTIVLAASTSFADDLLIGATVVIVSGTGAGQSRLITDWVSSTDTATVETWTTNPDNTSVYKVYATAPSTGGGSGLDAAGVRAALGMSSANLDTQLSGIQTDTNSIETKVDTIDNFLDTEVAAILAAVDTEVAAILADTNELQTDWADGGRLDLILDARASQTSVDTVDTVVDAVKVKTDQLTFGVTNTLNANITYVNEVAVAGDGETGTEWGPA